MNVKYLLENWRSWKLWRDEYRFRILPHVLRNRGIYIVDEDWDNLIILDACRYDLFAKYNTIEGKLEFRISRGSFTPEFLRENFESHPKKLRFDDIVYVSANPFVSKLLANKFQKIYPTWNYGWDCKLNTVPPENVVKDALKADRKHPDKRLIIHFVQPHYPFLTVSLPSGTGFQRLRKSVLENKEGLNDTNPWSLVAKNEISITTMLKGYTENLEIVLRYVKSLLNKLSGKTVVTSDHGELFGERPHRFLYPFKTYEHPPRFYVESLVKVPWLVVDGKPRKKIFKGDSKTKTTRNGERSRIKETIDKLKALGYI